MQLQFDVSESPHFKGNNKPLVETVSFIWQREGVHLVLYQADDMRGAVKTKADGQPARANLTALRKLIDAAPDAPTNNAESAAI